MRYTRFSTLPSTAASSSARRALSEAPVGFWARGVVTTARAPRDRRPATPLDGRGGGAVVGGLGLAVHEWAGDARVRAVEEQRSARYDRSERS